MKKKIIIIGSTGSMGTQTLDVIRDARNDFEIVGLAAGRNTELFKKQIEEFRPEYFWCLDDTYCNVDSLLDLVQKSSFDLLVAVSSGTSSYEAIMHCLRNRIPVALANKEIIVSHGEEIRKIFAVSPSLPPNPSIIPLDSEHSALFQCLAGENPDAIKRVIITASGGAIRDRHPASLKQIKPHEILNHPTWKMGKKVTVDSATLANKAFEVIEAHYLFGIPYEKIEVRIHRESKIHAIVEFQDGTSRMVAFQPDMRIPISYALSYPAHFTKSYSSFNFDQALHFEPLDTTIYPCFDLILQIAKNSPHLLSTIVEADEQAVNEFLAGNIAFTDIYQHLTRCIPTSSS